VGDPSRRNEPLIVAPLLLNFSPYVRALPPNLPNHGAAIPTTTNSVIVSVIRKAAKYRNRD
jgi:hypothetical protein